MMHYTRAQGFTDLPTEVAEVARAARDVGVRTGFAVSMRDRNPLVYGASEPVLSALPAAARAEIEGRFLSRSPLQPKDQIALVDAVAEAAAGPDFNVQYGPNGVQWCSNALLEGIAEASQRTGRRVHMHLLETRYQRAWLDANYPDGGVRFLDKIGLLSPRLTLAHCVWARPDELELLAERGVTIVTNSSSNLHLRSGVAPAGKMLGCGCRLALGIDGRALDDDDDALREMRLTHLLHAGTGFTTAASQAQILQSAVGLGRLSVTNRDDGGAIVHGAPADLLLLDWAALEDDRLRDDLRSRRPAVLPRHVASYRGSDRCRPNHRQRPAGARRRSARRAGRGFCRRCAPGCRPAHRLQRRFRRWTRPSRFIWSGSLVAPDLSEAPAQIRMRYRLRYSGSSRSRMRRALSRCSRADSLSPSRICLAVTAAMSGATATTGRPVDMAMHCTSQARSR